MGGGYSPKILYSPKNLSSFLYLGLEYCYKKLTIKLLYNFNNFNSRLPASSQHHIKYFNPQKAHPCVIPRILSYHASKSAKAFDLCACLRKNCETKSFQLLGALPPDPLIRGSAPGPAGVWPPISPPKASSPPPKLGVCRTATGWQQLYWTMHQCTQMQLQLHLVLVYLTRLSALTEDELRGESWYQNSVVIYHSTGLLSAARQWLLLATSPSKLGRNHYPPQSQSINEKSAQRRKHCALAVVTRSQKFSPRRRPFPGRRMAKI